MDLGRALEKLPRAAKAIRGRLDLIGEQMKVLKELAIQMNDIL